MRRVLDDERGMALAIAIFALVVIGAIVAGAFFAGNQSQRVGENSRRMAKSFGVAEEAVNEVVASWNPQAYSRMKWYPADSTVLNGTTLAGTGTYAGVVRKLNDHEYLVDMTAQDKNSASGKVFGGGARQRVGMLLRVRVVDMKIGASLTTRGSVKFVGNADANGNDHLPDGWSNSNCDTTGDSTKAGVRVPDPSQVSGGGSHYQGNPPVLGDTTVSGSTFTQFGDISYADLVSMATINLPGGNYQSDPVVTGGVCDRTVITNWGDGVTPTNPCGSYFPIIHIAGSATMNGDQGQGILLVDGDLSIQGSFQFFGITVIQGSLKTAGGGSTDAHFWGAVMAGNVDLEVNSLSGNATLNYSKCAITQALEMTQVVVPDRARNWSLLF